MSIQLDSVIARNEDIYTGQIDDELVMVSINTGNYFVLNLTAHRIWEILESPLSVAEICAKLMEEFEVDLHTCQAEVIHYIEKLLDQQIIKIN